MTVVKVLKVFDWKQSQFSDGDYKRIVFELLDQPKIYVYLNLLKKEQWVAWNQACAPGNLLEVVIRPNTHNVNQFESFRVLQIKEINKDEVRDDNN